MMLNWDLTVIGNRSTGRADSGTAGKDAARSPQQDTIVALPAKTIHRIVSAARSRAGEPGQ